MTYLEVLNLIKHVAHSQPNVNSVVRDFDKLNENDVQYSCVVVQDREHSRSETFFTYRFYIGYVDRENLDKTNRDEIASNAISIISNICNTIDEQFDVTIGSIIVFEQRFLAECAGAYAAVDIEIPTSKCVSNYTSGAFNEDYNEDYDV